MARSGVEVAAGDGLGAFGATLILPVQMHSGGGRTTAMQWIYEKLSSIAEPRLAENQDHQIWAESPPRRAAARETLGHLWQPPPVTSPKATAAAGEQLSPPPHTGPRAEGGGGWPMHATAQPWHAEGRPLPNGALSVPAELVARLTSASPTLCRRAIKAIGDLAPHHERCTSAGTLIKPSPCSRNRPFH